MRSRTTQWFETTVMIERPTDKGMQKKQTELYVVDALSFGEAEETITREMAPFVTGEFQVKNITPATYGEVVFSDLDTDDKWYKAKLTFIVIDEEAGKEKKSNTYFLVQAATFNAAVKNVDEMMRTSQLDYTIANIQETKVMDVFEHRTAAPKNTKPEYEQQ